MTLYRWVQRLTPLLIDTARPCRHALASCWFVDETNLKVGGRWRYVYRAVDQHGQVIDVYVSARRDVNAARRFFTRVLASEHVERASVLLATRPAERVDSGADGDVAEPGGLEQLAPVIDRLATGNAAGPQVDRADGLLG